jgi:hypothetical protein
MIKANEIWLASWAMGTRECRGQVETEIYMKMNCRNILASQCKLTSYKRDDRQQIFGRHWLSCPEHRNRASE